MDFWAQHKDFCLKILAGFGVFLVAIIARGIVYGDDLKDAVETNKKRSSEIARMKIADLREIGQLETARDKLVANATELAGQIGWNAAEDDLDLQLVRRVLGYMRENRGVAPAELDDKARVELDTIRADLNGGFGQLRLAVRDDLVTEARELNVALENIGFVHIVELAPGELRKYLVQLELCARVVRYAIDARIDGFEEVQIETQDREVIPGANPEFLREYMVRFVFVAPQKAANRILDRLEKNAPSAPVREMRIERLNRPADHVRVTLAALAAVANPEAPFAKPAEQESKS